MDIKILSYFLQSRKYKPIEICMHYSSKRNKKYHVFNFEDFLFVNLHVNLCDTKKQIDDVKMKYGLIAQR